MKKRLFTLLILSLFTLNFSTSSTASSLSDLIKDNNNIEISVKGKKLKKYFSGNILLLNFEDNKKMIKFQEKI